ncbi:hypothetical protein ARSEF1564_004434 [Beauveria bassiana]
MYKPAPPRPKKTNITRTRTGCLECRARRVRVYKHEVAENRTVNHPIDKQAKMKHGLVLQEYRKASY